MEVRKGKKGTSPSVRTEPPRREIVVFIPQLRGERRGGVPLSLNSQTTLCLLSSLLIT